MPDHSSFAKNRHGRFRDSDLLRHVFETVVRRCIAEGLDRVALHDGIQEEAPSSDTSSRVAERYYAFNDIRPGTVEKYRRNMGLLIEQVGDVPIHHAVPDDLRRLRDKLSVRMVCGRLLLRR